MCCMVMCGLINMSLLKVAAEVVSEQEEALFMAQCRSFAIQCACLPFVPGWGVLRRVHLLAPRCRHCC